MCFHSALVFACYKLRQTLEDSFQEGEGGEGKIRGKLRMSVGETG